MLFLSQPCLKLVFELAAAAHLFDILYLTFHFVLMTTVWSDFKLPCILQYTDTFFLMLKETRVPVLHSFTQVYVLIIFLKFKNCISGVFIS